MLGNLYDDSEVTMQLVKNDEGANQGVDNSKIRSKAALT